MSDTLTDQQIDELAALIIAARRTRKMNGPAVGGGEAVKQAVVAAHDQQ
jgi:hypothetical protein